MSSSRPLLLLVLVGACVPPPAQAPGPPSAERGRVVYRRACASCHGERGDGRGPAAEGPDPLPRDFTRATYRFRSTPSGSLPTDGDLRRTVARGVPGTRMPAWERILPGRDIDDVVAYLKTFSPRFAAEPPGEPLALPALVPATPASLARGRALWKEMDCLRCHGPEGYGNGVGATDELKEDNGRVIRPANFHRGIYRSGTGGLDLARTIRAGVDGTPMPSFADAVAPEDVPHLVNYVRSFADRGLLAWLREQPGWYEPTAP